MTETTNNTAVSESRTADIAVLAPIEHVLSYQVPRRLAASLQIGCRVLVPMGNRPVMGVVTALDAEVAAGTVLKPIREQLDETPLLPASLVALLLWASRYYFAPPGEMLRAALPAKLQAKQRQLIAITDAGRTALTAHDGVLWRPEQKLLDNERKLLMQLVDSEQAAAGYPPKKTLAADFGEATVRKLLKRELIGVVLTQDKAPEQQLQWQLEIVEDLTAEQVDKLQKKAPKQAALLAAVLAHGGAATVDLLSEWRSTDLATAKRMADKGMLRCVKVPLTGMAGDLSREDAIELTARQKDALQALSSAASAQIFSGFLLHGVTGSGKTEIYLRLIRQVTELGRGALVLVPEIALTPQLSSRFRERFGDQVAVLHSGLSDVQRYHQWQSIQRGERPIVVGARSAIFAPIAKLGAVIVDEEHDGSFKQDDGVRYNARDLALVRAKSDGAVAVLGSATPSLESYQRVTDGILQLLKMPERATPQPLPTVEIVDLRRHRPEADTGITGRLASEIEKTLAAGKQSILFLNRRGYSSCALCKGCGHLVQCVNCSVSLTHHQKGDRLVCHYCGYSVGMLTHCPDCHAKQIALLGGGTQKVEEAVKAAFPAARVERMDRDTASTSKKLQEILDRVSTGQVDILVGTQMVTKGHDFPNVTLVGVLCADMGLHFPDFRASERTFQLLTQVAGRAGRGTIAGKVLVQTYNPEHACVRCAAEHDFEGFFKEELVSRQQLDYSPAAHLAAVHVDGANASNVESTADRIADWLRVQAGQGVQILGAAEAPLQKLKGKTRWLLLLKAKQRRDLRQLVGLLVANKAALTTSAIRVTIDIDPMSMM